MAKMIDATGLKADYQMQEGDGPAAVLTKDGPRALQVKSFKLGTAKESGNTTASLTFVVQDDDDKNAILYRTMPIEGAVASGPQEGRLNVTNLVDACISAGRMDLAQKIIGKKFDAEEILNGLVKQTCYARVQQKIDDRSGLPRSEPTFFMKREKYEEARQSGVNWRTDPRLPAARQAPGRQAAGGNNRKPAGTGTAPNVASTPSDDDV